MDKEKENEIRARLEPTKENFKRTVDQVIASLFCACLQAPSLLVSLFQGLGQRRLLLVELPTLFRQDLALRVDGGQLCSQSVILLAENCLLPEAPLFAVDNALSGFEACRALWLNSKPGTQNP